jgi:hypothetical protein
VRGAVWNEAAEEETILCDESLFASMDNGEGEGERCKAFVAIVVGVVKRRGCAT